MPEEWVIVGQGLAGSCLALKLLEREIPFRIVDQGSGGSSRVAAGLINPVTGRNFEPSWLIEDFHPVAIEFYRHLEKKISKRFWHPLPVLRLARSEKEWKKITSKLELPKIKNWSPKIETEIPEGFRGGVSLEGGGWLDTRTFLQTSREYFQESNTIEASEHQASGILHRTILCTGAKGLMQDQLGPHRCAKGEILTVTADWSETHIRIGAGGWLVPIGEHQFRVGSTYDWDQLDERPTHAGTERISEIASILGGPEFTITDHVAGIRPILRKSQPLIGKGPDGAWIFNALGSKGTLYAPRIADMLADWILEGIRPEPAFVFDPSKPTP